MLVTLQQKDVLGYVKASEMLIVPARLKDLTLGIAACPSSS